jgi:putative hydrolase of the HAD superfamily
VGKPEPAIFDHVLDRLGVAPAAATMVGDSLRRDVDGALAAGLRPVWINRAARPRPDDRPDLVEIRGLAELPEVPL